MLMRGAGQMLMRNVTRNHRNIGAVVAEALALMIVLQGVREFFARWLSPLTPGTRASARMLDMALMILLTVAVLAYARCRKQELSVFPKAFSKPYVLATCVTVLLYIAVPSNYTESFPSIIAILYGSIVTPVYEELLFRGYIWNRFQKVTGEKAVYVWNIALFALWHIGYMVPHILSGNWFAVTTKLAAGAVYGAVTGFIRAKTGNCWSTILAHGLMNLFMI